MADNVLESLLGVAKEINTDLLPEFAEALFGLETDVFFPVDNPSINPVPNVYNDQDNRYYYNATPDYSRKYIYIGLFMERFAGDETIDPYGNEVFILSEIEVDIPQNSKLIVKLITGQFAVFRVDQIMGFPGKENPVYKRFNLIPLEGTT